MTTASNARSLLETAFPGVEFTVKTESYARGTNERTEFLHVSYNFKRFPIDYGSVQRIVPEAMVWVRGQK